MLRPQLPFNLVILGLIYRNGFIVIFVPFMLTSPLS